MRTRVFGPSGTEWARIDEVLPIVPNRASGYQKGAGGELLNAMLSDVTNRVPGGGLAATAEDVARFARALLSGLLLKPDTLQLAFTPQRTKGGQRTGYGLGFVVGRGGAEVYHTGGQPRVSGVLWMAPRARAAVVLLCNLEGVSDELLELAREVGRIAG
jgi:CubicO group peptidase (beta-lactamase class C family)